MFYLYCLTRLIGVYFVKLQNHFINRGYPHIRDDIIGGLNNTQVCWLHGKVHTYFYLFHSLSFEGQGHMCKYKYKALVQVSIAFKS